MAYSSRNYQLSKQVVQTIRTAIDLTEKQCEKMFVNEINEDVESSILKKINNFIEDIGDIRVGLEQEIAYKNQTDFKNRKGIVRDNTGLRIFLDGVCIASLGGASYISNVGFLNYETGLTSGAKRSYSLVPVKENGKIITKKFHNLALVVFIDHKHGHFVNNIEGRKVTSEAYVKQAHKQYVKDRNTGEKKTNPYYNPLVKVGRYWQGTGWGLAWEEIVKRKWARCLKDIRNNIIGHVKTNLSSRALKVTEEESKIVNLKYDLRYEYNVPIRLAVIDDNKIKYVKYTSRVDRLGVDEDYINQKRKEAVLLTKGGKIKGLSKEQIAEKKQEFFDSLDENKYFDAGSDENSLINEMENNMYANEEDRFVKKTDFKIISQFNNYKQNVLATYIKLGDLHAQAKKRNNIELQKELNKAIIECSNVLDKFDNENMEISVAYKKQTQMYAKYQELQDKMDK